MNSSAFATETILYNFGATVGDGGQPLSAVTFAPNGELYGTTTVGGKCSLEEGGCGNVFKLAPPQAGSTTWSESVIYDFQNTGDGWDPAAAVTMDSSGNLYGTTSIGGVVYRLSPPSGSASAWSFSTLYTFGQAGDKSQYYLSSPLIVSGSLMGVASQAAGGNGAVYKIAPPASSGGAWVGSLPYSFSAVAQPFGGLVRDDHGNLYGTAAGAGGTGTNGCGTSCGFVFELSPNVASKTGWTETVLYSFTGASEAYSPSSTLTIDAVGNLYGTALGGTCTKEPHGCGTVFRLAPPATDQTSWTETVLHVFGGKKDGRFPTGALALDDHGNIYGATVEGGIDCLKNLDPDGCGTVFKLKAPENGATTWKKTTLHIFGVQPDGEMPVGGLTMHGGKLYGTTQWGGTVGGGTVFMVTP